jgi:putative ABC transport system ATP-binding protein
MQGAELLMHAENDSTMPLQTDAPVVRLDGVSRVYLAGSVRVPALTDVSLTITPRHFCMVVGPSGSGKTTLLNLIGCIDRPDAGRVEVCGQNVGEMSDDGLSDFRCRNIGFVFQSFNLIAVLSAYENIEYPLLMLGLPRAERRARVMDMLEAVGLTDRRDQRPNQLSGGQSQRVAIARALVKRPSLVLADEPTANLDTRTGASIIELMRRVQERYQTSFVFSTHDPQLMAHADETFTIRDGALVSHLRRDD